MTMKSTGITSKNFGTKLGGVVKSAKTMRANLQNLMLFGMEHYEASGDTVYLTKCMQSCVGVAALPTQKMKQFIQHHANVSWKEVKTKNDTKDHVFKKRGKDATYTPPTTNWWEFSTAGDVQPDLDTDAAILNLIKRIESKTKEGHVKNKTHAKQQLKMLHEMASALKIA